MKMKFLNQQGPHHRKAYQLMDVNQGSAPRILSKGNGAIAIFFLEGNRQIHQRNNQAVIGHLFKREKSLAFRCKKRLTINQSNVMKL